MGQLCAAVRHEQPGQREQRLTDLGQAAAGAGVEREVAERAPDDVTDRDADRDLADQVPADPAGRVGDREAAGRGDQQREVDEGEREPVVEAGLGGQREADLVVLLVR